LDLNATDATDDGHLGLALPRVALTSTENPNPLAGHVKGMIVYNTATVVGVVTPGTYYNDGSKWVRILITEADAVVGNEVIDATPNGGLARTGEGTADSPYTLGIDDGGVTAVKLNAMGATAGQVLMYNGSTWVPVLLNPSAYCSGAIVFDGAYNGPAEDVYNTTLNGDFTANWTNAVFSAQGKHLCWAADISGAMNWTPAKDACAALTIDNASWRLPNLRELHVLYEAIGGAGSSTTSFANLDSNGTGIANDAANMQSNNYWSSTEYSNTHAYRFDFINGGRGYSNKSLTGYVRCVRSL
jgi:hypothetical protein